MWLEAIITREDLVQVMGELLPVKLYLHKEGEEVETDRWLLFHPATDVTLVAEEGLRVTCPAELRWTIAGMSANVKIDELRLLIRPQVVEKSKGHALEFDLEIEKADFHVLPDFIDSTIVKAVNAALSTRKLPWNFTETFTRTVPLGKMLDPVEALKIEVGWGKRRIGEEALALVISFKLGFVRTD